LDLSSDKELEELIIDCIYEDLIKGQINQREKIFRVINLFVRTWELKTTFKHRFSVVREETYRLKT
jgi:hypothetical protein